MKNFVNKPPQGLKPHDKETLEKVLVEANQFLEGNEDSSGSDYQNKISEFKQIFNPIEASTAF